MRATAAMILTMLPAMGMAQEHPGAMAERPVLRITGAVELTPEDRTSYCFWAGQLYSIGASFCSRQQTFATCTEAEGRRPVWVNKENDKFCDRNTSPTPE